MAELKPSAMEHLEALLERHPELAGTKEAIIKAVEIICRCQRSQGKVLVCGNGGSAADSEHIVAELMKGFLLPRSLPRSDVERLKAAGFADGEELAGRLQRGVPAIALTGHPALSTAIVNDTDPYMPFAQQVYVLGRPGDVLLALSTSGNARNVVNALQVARAFGLSTLGFTGSRAAAMDDLCDVTIKVPAEETFRVQEYHLPVYHALCLMVEEELFGPEG